MTWFKHDTNASIDSKLQTLMLDYGASGYGLYWYCVELIAQKVDKNNITFELEHDARIIARNLNLTVQETTDMMKKMVELNLFSFSENNKLACYALAKRLDQSMTSNPDMRRLISQIKYNNHDVVMTESIDSHDKVMQEEKRREENRLEEISIKQKAFTFSLTNLTSVDRLSKKYLTHLQAHILEAKRTLSYEDFINGLEASGKQYKNFKSAYKTWADNKDKWDKGNTVQSNKPNFNHNNKVFTKEQAMNLHGSNNGFMISGAK